MNISDNVIDDVVVFAKNDTSASLFYIDGATLTAERNNFTRVGNLDESYHNFT